MPQKALAINDTIINDMETLEGDAARNATVVSALDAGVGLPAVQARQSERYGRWPLLSGVTRPGHKLTLMTMFKSAVATTRYAKRRGLEAELNPELEKLARLVVADTLPPEGLAAAFGPWDVYEDDASAWHCRDLLWTDADTARVEADITGAVHFEDGEQSRQRAIVIEEATTNLVDNPSFEIATTNWAANGAAAIARDTTEYEFGYASVKVTVTAAGTDGIRRVVANRIAVAINTAYTLGVSIKGVAGQSYTVRFDGDSSGVIVTEDFVATGDWDRWDVTGTTDGADTVAQVLILNASAVAHDFYCDGFQFEEKDHATTYCDGSRGPGYAWSALPHASGSTSTRTATVFDLDDHVDLVDEQNTLSFRVVAQMPYDHDGTWPGASNYLWDVRGADNNNRIGCYYTTADDKFNIYVNGAVRLSSAAQAFDAGDWVDLVATLDFTNDSYALYLAGASSDTDTTALTAPALTAWRLGSDYNNANRANAAHAEYFVWDRALTADEAETLYNNGAAAWRARYANVLCEAAQPLVVGSVPTDKGIVSTLVVGGDVRWRSRDGDVSFWQPAAATSSHVVSVDSDDDVYPILRLTPTTAKSTGQEYYMWVCANWKAPRSGTLYPVRVVIDSATPIGAGKMAADGSDLRVVSDGAEIDRWIDDINDATTNIWFNLNFQAEQSATLTSNMGAGDTVTEIEVDDSIDGFPSSGILLIDSEAFIYTGKNNATQTFTGVTRAVRNTAAGAHTGGTDIVYWIQHDVFIYYGGEDAQSADDNYKPTFELDSSTNDAWDYDAFGENDGLRAAQWSFSALTSNAEKYTAHQGTDADPWTEIGVHLEFTGLESAGEGRFKLYNPCGLTGANFHAAAGGELTCEKKTTNALITWGGEMQSSTNGADWATEYSVPAPVGAGWEAWDQDVDPLTTGTLYIGLYLKGTAVRLESADLYIEAADVTLDINATYAPDVTAGSEAEIYHVATTITNSTTDDAIEVAADMPLDETLEIDTYDKTVKNIDDGSNQFAALTLTGGARRDWFRLVPGSNTLTFSDTGTQEVSIDFQWHRRDWE